MSPSEARTATQSLSRANLASRRSLAVLSQPYDDQPAFERYAEAPECEGQLQEDRTGLISRTTRAIAGAP